VTRPRAYADATALIGLGRIHRLDLLTLLVVPVHVTTLVWTEVTEDPEKPGISAILQARSAGLLAVVEEGDPVAFPQLDPGECTVLTAAAMARAAVIIDERNARTLVKTDQRLSQSIPQSIGIVGLILLAKRRAYITAVRPLLDDLVRESFWMSPSFYHDILRRAGEL